MGSALKNKSARPRGKLCVGRAVLFVRMELVIRSTWYCLSCTQQWRVSVCTWACVAVAVVPAVRAYKRTNHTSTPETCFDLFVSLS